MTKRWSIKKKLAALLVLLLIALAMLSFSGISGIYQYRALARGVSRRSAELPLASEFARHVANLRVAVSRASVSESLPIEHGSSFARRQNLNYFRQELRAATEVIEEYRELVARNQQIEESDWRIESNQEEAEQLRKIQLHLQFISANNCESQDWVFDTVELQNVEESLEQLQLLSKELPSYLQRRMANFQEDVRDEYRSSIVVAWLTTGAAVLFLGLLFRLLYWWLLKPLRTLLRGARQVAAGDFGHRIHLDTQDEMAELSSGMNRMTSRFQEIKADLDSEVREQTKQVVRSEQLASVGFLAAGVAHEINNPLASIALCAESLEDRLAEIIQQDDELSDEEHNQDITVCRNYLRMMQDEAFRCKEITGRLLDFARIGEVEPQHADLGEVVRSVVGMVGHLRKHKRKKIVCDLDPSVLAWVNPQEIKQVVLNLITNALDSLDVGGQVTVRLESVDNQAKLTVSDNGCGMDAETLKHLFEPFFTRRRDGSGTGLGTSISYRIICDHGGTITPSSDGPGKGSKMIVLLPLSRAKEMKESSHYKQAA